ncbi:hypothetical protein C8J56DRAFT_1048998 [Mycena floridula]|nr:hypothetical protein C8J56DRAFT_1048998 [Mycena floridula]
MPGKEPRGQLTELEKLQITSNLEHHRSAMQREQSSAIKGALDDDGRSKGPAKPPQTNPSAGMTESSGGSARTRQRFTTTSTSNNNVPDYPTSSTGSEIHDALWFRTDALTSQGIHLIPINRGILHYNLDTLSLDGQRYSALISTLRTWNDGTVGIVVSSLALYLSSDLDGLVQQPTYVFRASMLNKDVAVGKLPTFEYGFLVVSRIEQGKNEKVISPKHRLFRSLAECLVERRKEVQRDAEQGSTAADSAPLPSNDAQDIGGQVEHAAAQESPAGEISDIILGIDLHRLEKLTLELAKPLRDFRALGPVSDPAMTNNTQKLIEDIIRLVIMVSDKSQHETHLRLPMRANMDLLEKLTDSLGPIQQQAYMGIVQLVIYRYGIDALFTFYERLTCTHPILHVDTLIRLCIERAPIGEEISVPEIYESEFQTYLTLLADEKYQPRRQWACMAYHNHPVDRFSCYPSFPMYIVDAPNRYNMHVLVLNDLDDYDMRPASEKTPDVQGRPRIGNIADSLPLGLTIVGRTKEEKRELAEQMKESWASKPRIIQQHITGKPEPLRDEPGFEDYVTRVHHYCDRYPLDPDDQIMQDWRKKKWHIDQHEAHTRPEDKLPAQGKLLTITSDSFNVANAATDLSNNNFVPQQPETAQGPAQDTTSDVTEHNEKESREGEAAPITENEEGLRIGEIPSESHSRSKSLPPDTPRFTLAQQQRREQASQRRETIPTTSAPQISAQNNENDSTDELEYLDERSEDQTASDKDSIACSAAHSRSASDRQQDFDESRKHASAQPANATFESRGDIMMLDTPSSPVLPQEDTNVTKALLAPILADEATNLAKAPIIEDELNPPGLQTLPKSSRAVTNPLPDAVPNCQSDDDLVPPGLQTLAKIPTRSKPAHSSSAFDRQQDPEESNEQSGSEPTSSNAEYRDNNTMLDATLSPVLVQAAREEASNSAIAPILEDRSSHMVASLTDTAPNGQTDKDFSPPGLSVLTEPAPVAQVNAIFAGIQITQPNSTKVLARDLYPDKSKRTASEMEDLRPLSSNDMVLGTLITRPANIPSHFNRIHVENLQSQAGYATALDFQFPGKSSRRHFPENKVQSVSSHQSLTNLHRSAQQSDESLQSELQTKSGPRTESLEAGNEPRTFQREKCQLNVIIENDAEGQDEDEELSSEEDWSCATQAEEEESGDMEMELRAEPRDLEDPGNTTREPENTEVTDEIREFFIDDIKSWEADQDIAADLVSHSSISSRSDDGSLATAPSPSDDDDDMDTDTDTEYDMETDSDDYLEPETEPDDPLGQFHSGNVQESTHFHSETEPQPPSPAKHEIRGELTYNEMSSLLKAFDGQVSFPDCPVTPEHRRIATFIELPSARCDYFGYNDHRSTTIKESSAKGLEPFMEKPCPKLIPGPSHPLSGDNGIHRVTTSKRLTMEGYPPDLEDFHRRIGRSVELEGDDKDLGREISKACRAIKRGMEELEPTANDYVLLDGDDRRHYQMHRRDAREFAKAELVWCLDDIVFLPDLEQVDTVNAYQLALPTTYELLEYNVPVNEGIAWAVHNEEEQLDVHIPSEPGPAQRFRNLAIAPTALSGLPHAFYHSEARETRADLHRLFSSITQLITQPHFRAFLDRVTEDNPTKHFFRHHCTFFRLLEKGVPLALQGFNLECLHQSAPQSIYSSPAEDWYQPRNPLLLKEEDEYLYHSAKLMDHLGYFNTANSIREIRSKPLMRPEDVRKLLRHGYLDSLERFDRFGQRLWTRVAPRRS